MNVFKNTFSLAGLAGLLALTPGARTAAADDSQLFTFKFHTNQPLVYAITMKSRTVMDNNVGGKTSLVKNSSEVRYKIRLTDAGKKLDGATAVFYEPFDVEEDLDVVGTGHVVTQIRGLQVRSTQNGIVTIDPEKSVGLAQAKPIKTGVYPIMLSGYLYLDPAGHVKKVEGDLPFIDHWTEALKQDIGFFHVHFPSHAVGVQEAWTENVSVNAAGGVTLADPLTTTNTFTRELDQTTDGNRVATFTKADACHLQNLGGYFEQMGQKSSLNVSQFDQNSSGTFHFDPKRGVLLDAKSNDSGTVAVEMLVQGNAATSHLDMQMEMQMTLTEPPAK